MARSLDAEAADDDHPSSRKSTLMRYGTAMVVKAESSDVLSVSASVVVERTERPELSYFRCSADLDKNLRAAAISGARFARNAIDRECFGIEILDATGDLRDPGAEHGLALAVTFAVWSAWGYEGTEEEVGPMLGWKRRRDEP